MPSRRIVETSLVLAALAALVLAPRPALADDSMVRGGLTTLAPAPASPPAAPVPPPYAPPPPPPGADLGERTERVWYGQSMLIVDLAASATIYGALELKDQRTGLATVGALTFVFGPPIVHLMNGQFPRGLASLGLRTSLPLTAAMIGLAVDKDSFDCSGDVCEQSVDGFLWGGLIGMGVGALLDDLLLAHKTVRYEPARWVPGVARAPGGGLTFGVSGVF